MTEINKKTKNSIEYIPLNSTGEETVMGFHAKLLDDKIRTGLFIKAIQEVVKKGDVVVDYGTGTGILALACCRAGAKKVYAIEKCNIIKFAREAARANGFEDRIIFIQDDGSNTELPEEVDVIVSECLGLMAVSSMMAGVTLMAKKYLRKDGKIIPHNVSLFLGPVESSDFYNYSHVWEQNNLYDFDLSAFQKAGSNNIYVAWFNEEDFISPPQQAAELNLYQDSVDHVVKEFTFAPSRGSLFHGYCGWFDACLSENVVLSTSPFAKPTIWKQSFLPLEKEVPVGEKNIIKLNFERNTTMNIPGYPLLDNFIWDTDVFLSSEKGLMTAFRQSTVKSYP